MIHAPGQVGIDSVIDRAFVVVDGHAFILATNPVTPRHAALRHAAAIVLRHNRALAVRGPPHRQDHQYEGSLDEQVRAPAGAGFARSEEHTSELQSLMRISYAVFCLKKKKTQLND